MMDQDYNNAIEQKEKEINDLKQMQRNNRLKYYYVILADLNGNFYLNIPTFIKNNLNKPLVMDGNGMWTDERITKNFYPKYKKDSFEHINTAVQPLEYYNFLFTKNEALQYADDAELPILVKEGIRPATNLRKENKDKIFNRWFKFLDYKH